MADPSDSFGRIAKLFVDTEQVSLEVAREKLSEHRVSLVCGPDLASSPSLQAALLTAVNVANRCFPGAVSVYLPYDDFDARPLVPWPSVSIVNAVRSLGATVRHSSAPSVAESTLVFGTRPDVHEGLQVTFDGWAGAVCPVAWGGRLAERERYVLAGVLAGALGVGEIFLQFAGVNIEATRRTVGLSLWRPDVPLSDPAGFGVSVEFLPQEFWVLGLGHLGQAFLWCIGMLPFSSPAEVAIFLQDFDRIAPANLDTQILTSPGDVGRLKTRVALRWLRRRRFDPRIIERPFGPETRRLDGEPRLALCGFDFAGPRESLDDAGFTQVVECGLGGRADNFHCLHLHTLPDGSRHSRQIWPTEERERVEAQARKRQEKLARENAAYRELGARVNCGQVEMAGKAVAVPFVGAVAGALVISETLRVFHEGGRYASLEFRLGTPESLQSRVDLSGYQGRRQPRIGYQPVSAFMQPEALKVGNL